MKPPMLSWTLKVTNAFGMEHTITIEAPSLTVLVEQLRALRDQAAPSPSEADVYYQRWNLALAVLNEPTNVADGIIEAAVLFLGDHLARSWTGLLDYEKLVQAGKDELARRASPDSSKPPEPPK